MIRNTNTSLCHSSVGWNLQQDRGLKYNIPDHIWGDRTRWAQIEQDPLRSQRGRLPRKRGRKNTPHCHFSGHWNPKQDHNSNQKIPDQAWDDRGFKRGDVNIYPPNPTQPPDLIRGPYICAKKTQIAYKCYALIKIIIFCSIRVGNRRIHSINIPHMMIWILALLDFLNKLAARHIDVRIIIMKSFIPSALIFFGYTHSFSRHNNSLSYLENRPKRTYQKPTHWLMRVQSREKALSPLPLMRGLFYLSAILIMRGEIPGQVWDDKEGVKYDH